MARHFSNLRIKERIHAAPSNLTPQEVTFYLGANARTVRYWLKTWEFESLPIATLQGDRWNINKERLIVWLIMKGRISFAPEYGYPSPEEAGLYFERLSTLPPSGPAVRRR